MKDENLWPCGWREQHGEVKQEKRATAEVLSYRQEGEETEEAVGIESFQTLLRVARIGLQTRILGKGLTFLVWYQEDKCSRD